MTSRSDAIGAAKASPGMVTTLQEGSYQRAAVIAAQDGHGRKLSPHGGEFGRPASRDFKPENTAKVLNSRGGSADSWPRMDAMAESASKAAVALDTHSVERARPALITVIGDGRVEVVRCDCQSCRGAA